MPIMRKKVAVLGAGPAGLSLAMKLAQRSGLDAEVLVLEKNDQVGGLATSFTHDDLTFDLGSHRLHPATSSDIMSDLRKLLGRDLLDRPRYGRIRLFNRFVQFPLKPFELLKELPFSFVLGFVSDSFTKLFVKIPQNSFADVLKKGLGNTMCESFYFPYARKLWGLAPEEIAAVQAHRRVAAKSVWKMVAKVLYKVPGFRRPGAGWFFYPKNGFGQISRALAEEVNRLGGTIRLACNIEKIEARPDQHFNIVMREGELLTVDFVFSTIPLTILPRLLQPAAPTPVLNATEKLRFRGMVLHYLILGTNRFTPFDAHYFPDESLFFSRMSEPRNYSCVEEPYDKTGLCFEIPCNIGDDIWRLSDQELTERILVDLKKADLAVTCPVLAGFSRRIPFVYPIYNMTFAENLQLIQHYLSGIPNLISLGRQGLFVHDNTHQTIEMAYRAADCLDDEGRWHDELWQRHLTAFAENVVED